MPSRKDDGAATDPHRITPAKRKEAAKKGQSSRAIGPAEIVTALVVIAGQKKSWDIINDLTRAFMTYVVLSALG